MLRHRVDDRREDVQHEDHGRRQARHEKNCSRTGSPVPQKPRAERRSGGGVWCELSRVFADKRQRCPETAFTSLGRNKRGRQSHMTHTYLHTYTLTHTHAQWQFWQFTDGPPLPKWRMCNFYFWAMWCFYKCHACCQVDTSASERLLISERAHFMFVGLCHFFVSWKCFGVNESTAAKAKKQTLVSNSSLSCSDFDSSGFTFVLPRAVNFDLEAPWIWGGRWSNELSRCNVCILETYLWKYRTWILK